MVPVPKRIVRPSAPSSSPSSISRCRGLGTGNRGNGRRVTKVGNNLISCASSEFVRSGDVHTLKYCSSSSSSNTLSSTCENGGASREVAPGSSWLLTVNIESAFGECEFDPPTEGASKNGSLEALGRFPTSTFGTEGCGRRTRKGIEGEEISLLKMGSGTLEDTSSNPRT